MSLGEGERALVRVAAAAAGSSEMVVRRELASAAGTADPREVEEVLLQTYLFAGFPRALNAMREWRRITGRPTPPADEERDLEQWRARGERTCRTVYGRFYDALRRNIAALHPLLDEWMLVDGYGKVLGRGSLPLHRRELCVVAACAAAGQGRQLHSHLIGALNAGAGVEQVSETLASIADLLAEGDAHRFGLLWERVRGK